MASSLAPQVSQPGLLRLPGSYPVQADTWLLADTLHELELAAGARVLDMCTGTGALAVAAGLGGAAAVTAVDISVRSTANAWINSRWHGVPTRVVRGDLFQALAARERFDVVVCNPPYVPSLRRRPSRHRQSRAWDAGRDGRLLIDRICVDAFDWLRPGGTLLMVHSTVSNETRSLERLRDRGFDARIIRRQVVPFGPVMHARAEMMRRDGLLAPDQLDEELVVIQATRTTADVEVSEIQEEAG